MTTALAARAYVELGDYLRETATLGSVAGLASWDQETYMPSGAASFRAEQLALLAKLTHERSTSARLGELIAACEGDREVVGDGTGVEAANLRELRRDYERAVRLPASLVAEEARVTSQAQEAWKRAKERSDFAMFRPWLEKVMGLMRQKADCLMTSGMGERYDALLDLYEPGAKSAEIARVFGPLRDRLSGFIREVAARGRGPETGVLSVRVPEVQQHELGMKVLGALGFDLGAGRLDTTAHPFCTGFAPGDTRLTTRYRDDRFIDALYGTMHECGHGLYEQGLPKMDAAGVAARFGQPVSEAVSLGIHESQSRMWENFVGRSPRFWAWALPVADGCFGGALSRAGATAEVMGRAVNTCTPSLIRVEADEGTYNLHVMIRFELERALLRGELAERDLPGAWNAKYKEFLGLEVPDDRRGCLQDVHWAFGLVGYFPTYTLGNLYSAQFWEKAVSEMPGLEEGFARGEFGPLLSWLRRNIHGHGRRYGASELCERVTGQKLSAEPLLRHLERRIKPAYGMA